MNQDWYSIRNVEDLDSPALILYKDRIANNIGWFGRTVGELIRQFQTGQLQGYGMALSAGIVVIFGIYLLFL